MWAELYEWYVYLYAVCAYMYVCMYIRYVECTSVRYIMCLYHCVYKITICAYNIGCIQQYSMFFYVTVIQANNV